MRWEKEEQYIKVSEILDYCEKAAEISKSLADKCIDSVGKGESQSSSLGGAAYFLERARMFEYDIPEVIKGLNYITSESVLSSADKTSIEALSLSTRSYQVLKIAGLNTLGDITKLNFSELKSIKGLGVKSLREIMETLRLNEVSLKGGHNDKDR